MATLQNIRSKGPLLLIVIGLALLAFIAGDAWQVLQPHQSQDVGEINGESISAQDYQALVDEYVEVVKFSNGLTSLDEEQTERLKDEVWRTYVNNKLIEAEAEKLGLEVTDAEIQSIRDAGVHPMVQHTPFRNPQTGAFDKDMLKKFLVDYSKMNGAQMPSQYMEYYESMYRFWSFVEKTLFQTRLQEKYQSLLAKSMLSNPVEAQLNFDDRTIQKDALLAAIPYSSVADSVISVEDAELKEAYEKKKEQFRQYVETRNIRFIDVQVTASAEDRAAIEKEMEDYTTQLQGNVADYSTFIRSTGSTCPYVDLYYTTRTLPADVIARLDSVSVGKVYGPYYNATDNTINSFKKLASATLPDSVEFCQIQIASEDANRTKTLADSIYKAIRGGADFAEIAKKYGQTGEATKVLNKKAPKDKYKVAIVKRPVEFSKETYNKAYNDFSQFIATNNTLEKMVANAEDAGYRLYPKDDLYSSEHGIGGVKGTKEALRWAFAAKVGEVSGLYECGDNDHLMVVGVAGIIPEGYRPLALVKEDLRRELIRDKKAEKIMADMKTAGATSFEQYKNMGDAVSDSVKHITFSAPAYISTLHSREPLVGAYTSMANLNQLSSPIKGEGGVYVLQPYAEEKINETFDKEAEEVTLENRYANIARQFINDLYLEANVVDNRYLFF